MKSSPDLGKSLPWPKPPRSLVPTTDFLKKVFLRWRAYVILSKYPREEWPEMHLKISTMEILKGKRNNWGINR